MFLAGTEMAGIKLGLTTADSVRNLILFNFYSIMYIIFHAVQWIVFTYALAYIWKTIHINPIANEYTWFIFTYISKPMMYWLARYSKTSKEDMYVRVFLDVSLCEQRNQFVRI